MISKKDPNYAVLKEIVKEFTDHLGFHDEPHVSRIFTSPVLPEERQVLQVTCGEDSYALKIDFTSDVSARLQREYEGLTTLNAHFQSYDKLATATPVYLSPSGIFFAMNFVNFRTAGQRLKESQQLQTTKQVYRRAGLWLTAMHEFKPQKRSPFYGEWMFEEVDARVEDGTMQADFDDVSRMRDMLVGQIAEVQLTKDTRVWSHGDFHSENIMLGPGLTLAFDLTEARMKLALYDIVDFLKVDIFRQMPKEDIDTSGIIKSHREMFFRGYKHEVNPRLFEVAMRGRLLIDWVSISKKDHAKKESAKIRFARLKDRLDIAFRG